ncbi:MAG: hypothetical protein GXO97_03840 [Nitrospirae bacterium]|nr:hypothetical protein [Nitrospirota bacterium]
MKRIDVPKELLWDYKDAPDDLIWRLQRIADFFPAYGTDRDTVELLYQFRDRLRLEEGKYRLIGIYKEVWDEKTRKGSKGQ